MKKLRGRMGKTLASIALSALVLGSGVMGAPAPTKAAEAPTKITLLGTSDIHGRFMPWDYALDGPNQSGSLTQLFTMIKEIRKENPNTVLVDAGDSIQDNSAELFND